MHYLYVCMYTYTVKMHGISVRVSLSIISVPDSSFFGSTYKSDFKGFAVVTITS